MELQGRDGRMRRRTLWSVPSKLSANFALDAHHYCCALCVSLLQNVKYGEIHWIYSAEPNITGEWQQQSNLHLKSSSLGVSFPLTFPSFFLICVFSCLLFQSFRSFSCQLSCLLSVIRFVLVFIFSLVPLCDFIFMSFPLLICLSLLCAILLLLSFWCLCLCSFCWVIPYFLIPHVVIIQFFSSAVNPPIRIVFCLSFSRDASFIFCVLSKMCQSVAYY